MIDTCERCDGVGCRYCSGRGWLSKAVELPSCPSEVQYCRTCPEAEPCATATLRARGVEPSSRPAPTDDVEPDAGEVEPEDWPPEVCRSCNQVTGIDDRNGLCADCNRELKKASPAAELQEPEERVRITVQYPDHPVKLLRVRYGTLSRALAEVFGGRPWS